MSITIDTTPDAISAAYRPVIWTCTSDDGDVVRVIAEVKIDGTIRASIDKDPDLGQTDNFTFDVQNVLQDFLTHNLVRPSGNDVSNASTSEVSVLVELHEVLDTTADTLSTTWEADGTGTGDITSSAIVAVNATLQHEETQDMDLFSVDSSSGRYLTNSPSTLRIQRTETAVLHFVTNEASVKVLIIQRRANDSIVTSTAFPGSAKTIDSKAGIIEIDASIISSSAAYFTIQLADSGLSAIKESFRFNIDGQCYDNDIRLRWLNPLGGMDSYTFSSKKKEEVRFSQRSFDKVIGNSFNVEDRGDTTLKVSGTDHIEIFSRSEPRATITWLDEIGMSSQVWIDDGTNFVPYIVTSRKTKVLDTENGVQTVSFKLKKSNKRETQKN